jgi:hypothetical protein
MANTFKFGNGNWATKEDSVLAYNSENGNIKPLPFDFTRASNATVVNKAGLIETGGSGEPRIDFKDDVKGALLLEPTRTNLLQYSEDFSNASWVVQANSTIVINTSEVLSPSGKNDAAKVFSDGTQGIYNNQAVINTESTRSVYIRSVSGVETLTIKEPYGGVSDKSIEVNESWQRYFLSGTASHSTNSGIFLDDISASGVYIWGAQVEQGSYATSYIPTSGSAVTRVADDCSGTGNEQVINSTEGVLYAEISALANDLTNRTIGVLGDSNNFIELAYRNSSNQVRCLIKSNGVVEVNIQHTLSDITLNNKLAIKYKLNNVSLYVNGIEVGTDLSANMPSGLNELNFNRFDGGENYYGKVKEVRVYNTALTDAELATLTT